MRTHESNSRVRRLLGVIGRQAVLAGAVVLLGGTTAMLGQAVAAVVDPLAKGPVAPDMFTGTPSAKVGARTAPVPKGKPETGLRQANFQTVEQPAAVAQEDPQTLPPPANAEAQKNPCDAIPSKPLNQLGISIAQPEGKLPTDLAGPCWTQINQTSAVSRCWPVFSYNWDATCFYHNPLYFEEVNLERYGYQCGDRSWCCSYGRECCLQPAASAAHFFGTIPALPYCLVADCPTECVYTLGHYRPGNCNPWRRNWPNCDPIAAVTAGGIWTGLIFLIP